MAAMGGMRWPRGEAVWSKPAARIRGLWLAAFFSFTEQCCFGAMGGLHLANEFRQVLDGDRAAVEHLFVELAQFECIAASALDGLTQSIECGSPDEVGGELARALLGALHFAVGFAFGLVAAIDEQLQRLIVGHVCAVHGVIEDRIEYGS